MSGQSTLETFFKIPTKRLKYFYLDWNDGISPQAQWLATCPKSITFEAQVSWRELRYPITVCGVSSGLPYQLQNDLGLDQDNKFVIPFLISHLQKCVRRQLSDLALSTAYYLMKLDLNKLLRRLVIIMVEDVQLQASVGTLVWLMSAVSKGYQPTQSQLEWVLGLVLDLCQDPVSDALPVTIPTLLSIPNAIRELEDNLNINKTNINLLYSLYFRCAYGGTDGDLMLIRNYARVWQDRFQSTWVWPKSNLNRILPKLENLMILNQTNLVLAAADFHCFPHLLKQIQDVYSDIHQNDINQNDLKLAIWHNSSNINYRYKQDPHEFVNLWSIIAELTQKLQKQLIEGIGF